MDFSNGLGARLRPLQEAMDRLLPVFGVVAFVLAGLLGFDAWQQGSVEGLAAEAQAARDRAAGQVRTNLQMLQERFDERRGSPAVAQALAGKGPAAAAAMVRDWEGAEAEFVAPDLAAAHADPQAFGYGKLALLEAALADNAVRSAVLRDAGEPRLAFAAPVLQEGTVLALAYLRLPTAALGFEAAAPGTTYIALRQRGYTVAQSGDAALAPYAEMRSVPIADSTLRVVAAAPQATAGYLGLGRGPEFVVAGALVLAGLGLLFRRRSRKRGARADAARAGEESTLAQMLQREPAPQATASVTLPARAAAEPVALDRSIFRAYDIRGVLGQSLDADVARLIGQAIGTVMQEKNLREIAVGRDGRLSGPELQAALIEGLRAAGRDVIDIGLAPTPLVYFASYHLRAGSCVAVTGSHNPPDYNGFKIVVGEETLAGDAIQDLYARIAEGRLHRAEAPGSLGKRDVARDYIERIAGDIQLERRLRVVVDAGSGVAGMLGPQVLEAIGAEVDPLFCEVDGTFPHHHPDPGDPHNLVDLIDVVQRQDADLGLAFDGDGDRLGVVTRQGEVIFPDRLLMLFATDVLERQPGACVIYDVKCTGHLGPHILRHGGSPLMWKTGHSWIKGKMRETGAELAGEMSGHFFFKERWYGFDDGIYAAARLLEILAAQPRAPEEVFADLPKGVSTPELKVPTAEGENYAFIERFRGQAKFEGARISTIDGVRADWPDGWGLVRASNTTPILVLRFDADSAEALARIQHVFREQLLAIKPDLQLPF